MTAGGERSATFECFGSSCAVMVIGCSGDHAAADAVEDARRAMAGWHERFSRFLPDSELSLLNRDPQEEGPVTPLMTRFAAAVMMAGSVTGGLVDATMIDEIEAAGYAGELRISLPLEAALRRAPERRRARPRPEGAWRRVRADPTRSRVTRPAGVKLDSGGLAKGLFADVLAERLGSHASYAVSCGGDLRIGGTASLIRPIEVESPFDGTTLHTFHRERTGVATSGIGRRAWLAFDGRPAHHLLDPATGRPAFTGLVQVTALAPSALLAEVYAKAAILSGPYGARSWLPFGGVIVRDDRSHEVIEPPQAVTLRAPYGRTDAPGEPETASRPNPAANSSVSRSAAMGLDSR